MAKIICQCRGKGWDINPVTRQREDCPVCNPPKKASKKLEPSDSKPETKKNKDVKKAEDKKEETNDVPGN